jgi:hypothetical protein
MGIEAQWRCEPEEPADAYLASMAMGMASLDSLKISQACSNHIPSKSYIFYVTPGKSQSH